MTAAARATERSSGGQRPPARRRRLPRGAFAAVCAAVIALAAFQVPLPLFAERALEPLAVDPILTVDGEQGRHDDDAGFLISLVGRRRATTADVAQALMQPDRQLRPAHEVVPPGVDDDDHFARRRAVFARSVDEAAAAALGAMGRSVPRRSGGVQVVDVLDDAPAAEVLAVDDVILAIDGAPVASPVDVREALPDDDRTVRLVVEREGARHTVEASTGAFSSGDDHGLGIIAAVAPDRVELPVGIEVDGGRTGGPSAGLMIALAVYDRLDDDVDLAAGRRVAGTGRIDADGRVTSVGGIATKVRGAIAHDADLLLVPAGQAAQAQEVADGRIPVVGVSDLGEAIAALRG